MKELKLKPPTDPRVQTAIAPYTDDMLKEHDIKDREELTKAMFACMQRFNGIGLTANQVGLHFNMFVAGGHPSIENGKAIAMYNPVLLSVGVEEIMMKEGCLTYPFLFLSIKRPRKCVFKYEDSKGELQEAHLDGMMSRICQHEYDHILGRNFVEHVSKFKLKRAEEKAKKMFDKMKRYNEQKTK